MGEEHLWFYCLKGILNCFNCINFYMVCFRCGLWATSYSVRKTRYKKWFLLSQRQHVSEYQLLGLGGVAILWQAYYCLALSVYLCSSCVTTSYYGHPDAALDQSDPIGLFLFLLKTMMVITCFGAHYQYVMEAVWTTHGGFLKLEIPNF